MRLRLQIRRASWRRWSTAVASPQDRTLVEHILELPLDPELRVRIEEPSSKTRVMLELLNDRRVVDGNGQETLIRAYLDILGIDVDFVSGSRG